MSRKVSLYYRMHMSLQVTMHCTYKLKKISKLIIQIVIIDVTWMQTVCSDI
jgi:hypothetical protein